MARRNSLQLYREDGRYTDIAGSLDEEAMNALEPIFKKYTALGYNIREIAHILASTVSKLELIELL